MAELTNGFVDGEDESDAYTPMRFSDIPRQLELPVGGEGSEETVEIDLTQLMDDPTELCTVLEGESLPKLYWVTCAMAYARLHKLDLAVDVISRSLQKFRQGSPVDRLQLVSCLCWLHLMRSREAHRLTIGKSYCKEMKRISCSRDIHRFYGQFSHQRADSRRSNWCYQSGYEDKPLFSSDTTRSRRLPSLTRSYYYGPKSQNE